MLSAGASAFPTLTPHWSLGSFPVIAIIGSIGGPIISSIKKPGKLMISQGI